MSRYQTSASKGTAISFPKLECWNPITKVATIAAEVDKERVLCRISLETLIKKFGASAEEPMRSVAQHRPMIQDAARKLLDNQVFEEDGSILIRARDFKQNPNAISVK